MAMILDAFLGSFSDRLLQLIHDEVTMVIGVSDEIEKLRRALNVIGQFAVDAERKRVEDDAVDYWVKQLKDAMYDADDILDECRAEAAKLVGSSTTTKAQIQSSSTALVRGCFSPFSFFRKARFRHEMGTRIKDLNTRLDEIFKLKSGLGLNINVITPTPARPGRKRGPVVEPVLVGNRIHEDTELLVRRLTGDEGSSSRTTGIEPLVFAIVGIGGIGKTTLAQKIFNHDKIKIEFNELMLWACVSGEYNDVQLLKEIIKFGGGDDAGSSSVELLEVRVESMVKGKKFLLVLDDVWQGEVWDDLLRKLFNGGATGSRVLITTRNRRVAMQVNATHSHHVDSLSSEDGWSLLCKMAGNGLFDFEQLKDTGMKIVKRCDGLPLAIRAVGGVLRTKETTSWAWEEVLGRTEWSMNGLPEGMKAALYLSYEDLPSHLKQCFAYFSLFPEDEIMFASDLYDLWIAEGFVKSQGNMALFEVAEEYYNDLVQRNLIQEYESNSYFCRMHDLLHSLARFLTRGESCCITDIQQAHTSTAIVAPILKLRRIKIVDWRTNVFPEFVTEQTTLRTLALQINTITNINTITRNMHDSFSRLCRLRVLDLSFTHIKELPDSLFNLLHLRYLNLAYTHISVIPTTISNLKNLNYLGLNNCRFLHAVPKSVSDLCNLRHLALYDTPVNCIPEGIGRIRGLEALTGFTLCRNNSGEGCTFEELGHLSNLRHLTIGNLEMVPTRDAAKIAAIGGKARLRILYLYWWRASPTGNFTVVMEEVMEELRPPPSIERLHVDGYMGHELPSWMPALTSPSSSFLSNLKFLRLENCLNWEQLPAVGHLPSLERLEIHGLAVTSLGSEFLYGGGGVGSRQSSSFRKLKCLVFAGLSILKEWQWVVGEEAMPHLEILKIKSCLKLGSLPGGLSHHATSLRELIIKNNERMQELGNFLGVQKLTLEKIPGLTRLSNLPALTTLTIEDCPSLRTVESVIALRELHLFIRGVTSLPDWLSQLTPNFIRITNCNVELAEKIRTREEKELGKIRHIPNIRVLDGRCEVVWERRNHEDSH